MEHSRYLEFEGVLYPYRILHLPGHDLDNNVVAIRDLHTKQMSLSPNGCVPEFNGQLGVNIIYYVDNKSFGLLDKELADLIMREIEK